MIARTAAHVAVAAAGLHVVVVLATAGYFGRGYTGRNVVLGLDFAAILLIVALLARLCLRQAGDRTPPTAARQATVLALGVLLVYLANGRVIAASDTVPARYLPLSILREGNFDLDEFPFLYGTVVPSFLQRVNGHYVSSYPVGAALLALPFYVPVAIGGVDPRQRAFLADVEKLAAATIVALSTAVLLLTLRRITDERWAIVLALIYALGTSSLSVSSQALWQHGAGQLALAVAIYGIVRARDAEHWAALAGFPLGFAVTARPPDVLIAAPLAVYAAIRYPRQLPGLLAAALPPLVFQGWYNLSYFGDPLHTQFPVLSGDLWTHPVVPGLAGVLFSPARGLVIYTPVVIVAFAGMTLAWRRGGDQLVRCVSVGTVLTLLLYAKWAAWHGGSTYGPRFLSDLGPVFAVAMCPVIPALQRRRSFHVVFVVLVVWSLGAHAVGAFAPRIDWAGQVNLARFPERAWWWHDNQLVNPVQTSIGRLVIAARRLPTSRSAEASIAASYRVDTAVPPRARPGDVLEFSLTACNDGAAVWLSSIERRPGTVHLVWRWLAEDGRSSPARRRDRQPIRRDVYPGRSHAFWVSATAPLEAGRYVLEIGLVDEGHADFSDPETAPLRFPVAVAGERVAFAAGGGEHVLEHVP